MTESTPFDNYPEGEWKKFEEEALKKIEQRLRRMRDAPDEKDEIYHSAWRTYLDRRDSDDPKHRKDADANTPAQVKARLMHHIRRKLRSQRDRRELEDNKALKFSILEGESGQPFEPISLGFPDDERLMEMLLKPCKKLTDRQRDVARLAMMNYDPKEIAEKLEIGVHTVYRELLVIRAAIDEQRFE
ncbi:helix-turn-helix transcriptional regulator [Thalassoglobus sp.]|uniref:helix-turn-helix transcriptional regulator n=1 Tax=Thalassoglobus sp. TaxID=2795869 RepID=UPI003AA7E42D